LKAVASLLAGVAVTAAAAALLWAWHSSSDTIERAQLTGLRSQVRVLERDLDAARERVRALEADAEVASRELGAAQARLAERAREPVAAPLPGAAAAVPPTPPIPERQSDWNAIVGSALDREVERLFGRRLTADQKARLVATLATVRDSSRRLNETPLDPADPASVRDHVAQQEALLAADRAFENEIGMGVSAFVRGLSAGKVEEAFPPDSPR
jgi:hypothetical protein